MICLQQLRTASARGVVIVGQVACPRDYQHLGVIRYVACAAMGCVVDRDPVLYSTIEIHTVKAHVNQH
jgi:hypothetical protein